MFLITLKSEQMKLHKSPIWIPFFAIPFISAFMGTFNYLGNKDILTKEWYSLWTQYTIFYCYFFFPVLIGIYCAYLCRLENINNNWNNILTSPVSINSIYFSKFITVMKMLFFTQIFEGILFYISGKLVGITTKIPSEIFLWLLLGFLAGVTILSVQLAISMMIKSFAVSIGISLLGGFLGVAATAKGFGLYFPYSLFPIGMCANNPSDGIGYCISDFFTSCALFVIIFNKLGIMALKANNN